MKVDPTIQVPAAMRPTPLRVALAEGPRELSGLARRIYRQESFGTRLIQHYRPYLAPFHRLIELVPAGSTVLDVGCGGGLFLALLWELARIRSGVGFDSDPRAIRVAQSATSLRAGTRAIRFEHSAVESPWPGGQFDVVSVVDVMHHVPRPHRAALLKHAVDRLRPGGRLLYKDPGHRPRWRAAMNTLHDLVLARELVSYTPLPVVLAWAGALGLRHLHTETINMVWYGHEIAVFEKPLTATT